MIKMESNESINIPKKDMEEILDEVKTAEAFSVITPGRCVLYGDGYSILTFLPVFIKSLLDDLKMPRESVEYAISLAFEDSEKSNNDIDKKLDKLEALVDKLRKLKGDK